MISGEGGVQSKVESFGDGKTGDVRNDRQSDRRMYREGKKGLLLRSCSRTGTWVANGRPLSRSSARLSAVLSGSSSLLLKISRITASASSSSQAAPGTPAARFVCDTMCKWGVSNYDLRKGEKGVDSEEQTYSYTYTT